MQELKRYRIEKVPCPIVYIRKGNKVMPVELFFD